MRMSMQAAKRTRFDLRLYGHVSYLSGDKYFIRLFNNNNISNRKVSDDTLTTQMTSALATGVTSTSD